MLENCIMGCHGNHELSQGLHKVIFENNVSHYGVPINN